MVSHDLKSGRVMLPTPTRMETLGEDVPLLAGLRGAIDRLVDGPETDGPGLASWAQGASLRVEVARESRGGGLAEMGPFGDESYGILVDASGEVRVNASTRAGLRQAGRTLRQLINPRTGRLARVRIEDRPGFATRGLMLDVSRNRVPTMEHLRAVIDTIASLKFNHLELYTEHTFAYAGHEAAWRGASPITREEMSLLDTYAAARGVELSANQNCFGHLAKWLKLPEYRELAEMPSDDSEWMFMQWVRRGPFSLCPVEPKAVELVRDLVGQIGPTVRSRRINIGCDETFDVGWGRSKAEAERISSSGGLSVADARARLYFGFVKQIAAAVAAVRSASGERLTPMMWADIALSHPEMLDELPTGIIGLTWEYEPTGKFKEWCAGLIRRGHEAWVCPGTSSWRSFTGRTRERRGNIADAAEQGAREGGAGAAGFMVCEWGDVGHRQQWPIALAGIAQAAEAAWNPARARSFDARAASAHVYCDPGGTLGGWLDELGDVDADVRAAVGLRNATALFNDLTMPLDAPLERRPIGPAATLALWHQARNRLESLRASRPGSGDALVDSELDLTLLRVELALDHAILARELANGSRAHGADGARRRLSDLAEGVISEHRRLWLARSRAGGLGESAAHDEAILAGIKPKGQAMRA